MRRQRWFRGLDAPDQFRAIINIHYDLPPPAGSPFMTGVINRNVEWIFAFKHRISATISHADRLLALPRQELAETVWREITDILGMDAPLPKWQLVRERRATFAATPEQNARRPGARTRWSNLFLAGDWTDTGLPSTIEGAIRSGATRRTISVAIAMMQTTIDTGPPIARDAACGLRRSRRPMRC